MLEPSSHVVARRNLRARDVGTDDDAHEAQRSSAHALTMYEGGAQLMDFFLLGGGAQLMVHEFLGKKTSDLAI